MTGGVHGAIRSPAGFDELVGRLASDAVAVRRVAVLDLIRLGERAGESGGDACCAPGVSRVAAALADHLPRETDEKALIAAIRHVGRAGYSPASGTLWALYADRSTPARVAHAAVIAHDTIASRETGRQPGHGS